METWIWGSLISLSLVLFLVLWKVWYSPSNLAWRKNFALSAPLGIRRVVRAKKEHGVFFLAKYGSFKEYLQKSDRIIRRNLTTALAKSFITHDVLAMTVSSRSFGWEHVRIISDHQKRMAKNRVAWFFATLLRSLAFWWTNWGDFDEIYVRTSILAQLEKGEKIQQPESLSKMPTAELLKQFGRRVVPSNTPKDEYTLVCFCKPIIKGVTVRGMWFYQKTSCSKLSLFHFFHHVNLKRGFVQGLQCLDAGPSDSQKQITAKEKMGYQFTLDWVDYYQGDYQDPPLLCSLDYVGD